MTTVSVASSSRIIDVSDSEDLNTSLESLSQQIAKWRASHRSNRNRREEQIVKLKESKEKYERGYKHELHHRTKDKEHWQQRLADKDEETKKLKRDTISLKKQLKELRLELRAKSDQLKLMAHFFCDICFTKQKCRVTRCGHGFCDECLDQWIDAFMNQNDVSIVGEGTCPTCRRRLNQRDDVWPLYLPDSGE